MSDSDLDDLPPLLRSDGEEDPPRPSPVPSRANPAPGIRPGFLNRGTNGARPAPAPAPVRVHPVAAPAAAAARAAPRAARGHSDSDSDDDDLPELVDLAPVPATKTQAPAEQPPAYESDGDDALPYIADRSPYAYIEDDSLPEEDEDEEEDDDDDYPSMYTAPRLPWRLPGPPSESPFNNALALQGAGLPLSERQQAERERERQRREERRREAEESRRQAAAAEEARKGRLREEAKTKRKNAERLMKESNWGKALSELQSVIRSGGADDDDRIRLIKCYVGLNQFDEALLMANVVRRNFAGLPVAKGTRRERIESDLAALEKKAEAGQQKLAAERERRAEEERRADEARRAAEQRAREAAAAAAAAGAQAAAPRPAEAEATGGSGPAQEAAATRTCCEADCRSRGIRPTEDIVEIRCTADCACAMHKTCWNKFKRASRQSGGASTACPGGCGGALVDTDVKKPGEERRRPRTVHVEPPAAPVSAPPSSSSRPPAPPRPEPPPAAPRRAARRAEETAEEPAVPLFCEACGKHFNSAAQREQHLASNAHLSKVEAAERRAREQLQEQARLQFSRTIPCQWFLVGDCHRGDACPNLHDPAMLRDVRAPPSSSAPAPARAPRPAPARAAPPSRPSVPELDSEESFPPLAPAAGPPPASWAPPVPLEYPLEYEVPVPAFEVPLVDQPGYWQPAPPLFEQSAYQPPPQQQQQQQQHELPADELEARLHQYEQPAFGFPQPHHIEQPYQQPYWPPAPPAAPAPLAHAPPTRHSAEVSPVPAPLASAQQPQRAPPPPAPPAPRPAPYRPPLRSATSSGPAPAPALELPAAAPAPVERAAPPGFDAAAAAISAAPAKPPIVPAAEKVGCIMEKLAGLPPPSFAPPQLPPAFPVPVPAAPAAEAAEAAEPKERDEYDSSDELEGYKLKDCHVCMSRLATIRAYPCQHIAVCFDCLENLRGMKQWNPPTGFPRCIQCQRDIGSVQRVYREHDWVEPGDCWRCTQLGRRTVRRAQVEFRNCHHFETCYRCVRELEEANGGLQLIHCPCIVDGTNGVPCGKQLASYGPPKYLKLHPNEERVEPLKKGAPKDEVPVEKQKPRKRNENQKTRKRSKNPAAVAHAAGH